MSIYDQNNKIISIGNNYDFIQRLDTYEKAKVNFTLEMSNYVQSIYYNGKRYMYCLGLQSNKTFQGYNLIKSDLNNLPENKKSELNQILNTVKKENCKFYSVRYSLIPQQIKQVLCIDINNAYAQILYNFGFIQKKTFDFLITLKKPERLAAVGMIAGIKNRYYYENGKITECEIIESDFRPLFFKLVMETSRIMEALEKEFYKSWVFTWVDGIYFDYSLFPKNRVETILREINNFYSVPCKIEWVKDFDLSRNGQNILFNFQKQNKLKNKWEKKTYNFPDPNILGNISKVFLNNKLNQ